MKSELGRAHELLDRFWARLATHIRAEHLCLFPAIMNAPPELFEKNAVPSIEEVRATIDSLRVDHNFFMNELVTSIKLARAHLDAAATDASMVTEELLRSIRRVKQRLDLHNQLEETQVYRWPFALLSNSALERLESEIRHQVQHLPSRFDDNCSGNY